MIRILGSKSCICFVVFFSQPFEDRLPPPPWSPTAGFGGQFPARISELCGGDMEAGLVAWRARGISAQMMEPWLVKKKGSQWNSHPPKKSLKEVGVFEIISDNFA